MIEPMTLRRHTLIVLVLIACFGWNDRSVKAQTPAQISHTDIVWSNLRTAAVARVTVTCKQVSANQGDNAGTKSIGTGFVVANDLLITARHLLLTCASRRIEAITELSDDELAEVKESASQNLAQIGIEFAAGDPVAISTDDRFGVFSKSDFGYVKLPNSLKRRPTLCLAKGLNFTRDQLVTSFGYASGNKGRAYEGVIIEARDTNKLAESTMHGEPGLSGSPVANRNGRVVGMNVARNAGGKALFLPLSRAAVFLGNEGLLSTNPFPEKEVTWDERFKLCEVITAEPTGFRKTTTIQNDTGFIKPSQQRTQCLVRIDKERKNFPANSRFDITASHDVSKKDLAGSVTYRYTCTIVVSSDPIFPVRRDTYCGPRDPVLEPLDCD